MGREGNRITCKSQWNEWPFTRRNEDDEKPIRTGSSRRKRGGLGNGAHTIPNTRKLTIAQLYKEG